ncbi:MAG: ParA family protein [Aestuariibacter sp.]
MRIIACVNQKGGVGKTTICANLAYSLSLQGQRVVAIDLDPQAQLGQSFGLFSNKRHGIDQVFHGRAALSEVTQELSNNLRFISAGPGLQRLESTPMGKGRGLILKKALRKAPLDADFILLDCPPSSGFLVVNALAMANELLTPVTPDYFGMSGLSMLLATVKNFEKMLGKYRAHWIVVSRMQHRGLTKDVLAKLEKYFPENLVPVRIAERAVLAECPSHGKPVLEYAPKSPSSQDFQRLAEIIIDAEVST